MARRIGPSEEELMATPHSPFPQRMNPNRERMMPARDRRTPEMRNQRLQGQPLVLRSPFPEDEGAARKARTERAVGPAGPRRENTALGMDMIRGVRDLYSGPNTTLGGDIVRGVLAKNREMAAASRAAMEGYDSPEDMARAGMDVRAAHTRGAPVSAGLPRGSMGAVPQYSARQVMPGVTEVISPGQRDQSRFFTNLIESGASPDQLRGFMDTQRAQRTRGANISYEGPLTTGGETGGMLPRGRDTEAPARRPVSGGMREGSVYSFGRPKKYSGLGGVYAAALEAKANAAAEHAGLARRKMDIEEEKLGLEGRSLDIQEMRAKSESAAHQGLPELRAAQTAKYLDEIKKSMSKEEQMELQRQIAKDKNVASLREQIIKLEPDDERRLALEEQLQAYIQDLEYGLLEEAVPAETTLFGLWEKEPAKPAKYGYRKRQIAP